MCLRDVGSEPLVHIGGTQVLGEYEHTMDEGLLGMALDLTQKSAGRHAEWCGVQRDAACQPASSTSMHA